MRPAGNVILSNKKRFLSKETLRDVKFCPVKQEKNRSLYNLVLYY